MGGSLYNRSRAQKNIEMFAPVIPGGSGVLSNRRCQKVLKLKETA